MKKKKNHKPQIRVCAEKEVINAAREQSKKYKGNHRTKKGSASYYFYAATVKQLKEDGVDLNVEVPDKNGD